MIAVEIVFWLAALAIVYTYFLYPVVLIVLSALKQLRADLRYVSQGASRRPPPAEESLPTVAVLVAAFNEERHIAERIRNLLACDYPPDRLRIYIGSDGSSDATNRLVDEARHERIVFRPFEQRRGKPSVINDLAALAQEEILVFTDANTSFEPDAVRRLVRHFSDPGIGCVSGELLLVAGSRNENPDNVYWRYERVLKFFEGRLGALLGANGGVYGLRREHYRPIPPDTIVDDFSISVALIEQGLRCHYDPEARATEEIPPRIADEFRRRVRIGIGNYQALRRHVGLLHPRHGYAALAFLSHKCLRWFAPHCMVIALLTNLVLASGHPMYRALLAFQVVFYLLAAVGHVAGKGGAVPKLLRLPVFFVSMNMALLVGYYRYLTGGFSGTWARTAR
jgi:cellulose synthase/poly-beta-1,6-N-acetylglucosamine synthase-like glycosyltransferase